MLWLNFYYIRSQQRCKRKPRMAVLIWDWLLVFIWGILIDGLGLHVIKWDVCLLLLQRFSLQWNVSVLIVLFVRVLSAHLTKASCWVFIREKILLSGAHFTYRDSLTKASCWVFIREKILLSRVQFTYRDSIYLNFILVRIKLLNKFIQLIYLVHIILLLLTEQFPQCLFEL